LQSFPVITTVHTNNLLRPVVTIKVFHQKLGQRKLGQSVCCHYQSFLIIFVKELEGRIGGKSCKHEKMAQTLTNYENIAKDPYFIILKANIVH
jgi:hypothetical protein